jgi:hypothetical protein
MRLRIAWRVFIGRYDALNWGDNSGEWKNEQCNYRDITEKGFLRSGNEDHYYTCQQCGAKRPKKKGGAK